MPGKQLNLIVDQGATFTQNLVATTNSTSTEILDLSNYVVGESEIRKNFGSPVLATMNVDVGTAPTNGIIQIHMNDDTTANIAAGSYLYDVKIAGISNTVTSNVTASRNYVPEGISRFSVSANDYTITTNSIANVAFSDTRPYYIAGPNNVTLSLSEFPVYIGSKSLKVLQSGDGSSIGYSEIIFANTQPHGNGHYHAGNGTLITSAVVAAANTHPLDSRHFGKFGIEIPKGKRWIYSMYIFTSEGGNGEGFPIQLQAYTANSIASPNTTPSWFGNGAQQLAVSTGPHSVEVTQPSEPPGQWSRISTVIDLRTETPFQSNNWLQYTIAGNNHVSYSEVGGFGTETKLQFRNYIYHAYYGANLAPFDGYHPNWDGRGESNTGFISGAEHDNRISQWKVGDTVTISYSKGAPEFPVSNTAKIKSINQNAPWVYLDKPLTLPNGTDNWVARTTNDSLLHRNQQLVGSNTHTSIILSFSPYFPNNYDLPVRGSYVYVDGIQLEEANDVSVTTPSPLSTIPEIAGGNILVKRTHEGTITVTPQVTM
tara:strand:+ start:6577 stop:8199 length:1623 start_codon:yes stop_codon:yes gene_type:complete